MRIIPDAFIFPGIAARHYINLVVRFSKPNRRGDGNAVFAEGRQTYVILALNLARDGHGYIVRDSNRRTEPFPLTGLVRLAWIRCPQGRGCVTSQRCANG